MSSPSSNDLLGLAYSIDGQPFVQVVGSFLDTGELEVSIDGKIFLAAGVGSDRVEDYLYTLDTQISPQSNRDYGPLLDEIYVSHYSTTITEYMPFVDSVEPEAAEDLDLNFTVVLRVLEDYNYPGTTVLRVQEDINSPYTTNLNVLEDNLVAVTSATSASNPTEPTLILGGQVVWSNPATLPPNGLANARCYVNYKCDLIANQSLSDIFSWNLSITDGGGSWNVVSINDFGDFGEETTVAGLTGTITEKGRQKTNGSYGYIVGGILGRRSLNQPLAFVIAGNPQYTTLLQSQSLTLPDPDNWRTYRDASNAIANVSNVNVTWNINDYPMTDFSAQAGMTALEALNSIADNAGGKLRWTGANNYIVNYPNKPIGRYDIPDCCLIQGISKKCNLDLKTGIYNPGIYVFPQQPQFDAGTWNLPNGSTNPLVTNPEPTADGSIDIQVEEIFTASKLMTVDDPSFPIDLPFDYESIYIQSIVPVGQGGGVFVTTDPKRWYILPAGFGGSNVNWNDVGGILKPQVMITYQLFDQTNAAMADNHFILKIGIRRKNIAGQINDSPSSPDVEKQTLARTQQRFRWIPVCQWNIQVIFSGALPIPGFEIHGGIGDFQLPDGVIIESVDFSNPGILNITAIQWAEMQFYVYYKDESNVT